MSDIETHLCINNGDEDTVGIVPYVPEVGTIVYFREDYRPTLTGYEQTEDELKELKMFGGKYYKVTGVQITISQFSKYRKGYQYTAWVEEVKK